jgi:hypothetical protein
MYIMSDPFSDPERKKGFRRYSDLAGLTVALSAIALAVVVATSGGGRKKPTPNAVTQGQQLVANVEHGKSKQNRHFQGIFAIYNKYGNPSSVVVNPFVAPVRAGVTPQVTSPQTEEDYNIFALIATKNPTTGKITFRPDEVFGYDKINNYGGVSLEAQTLAQSVESSSTPIQQTTVGAVSATSVGNPNHYVFSPADEPLIKQLGHYTYSVVGNEVLVPTGGASSSTGGHEPEGLLLSAHPAQ